MNHSTYPDKKSENKRPPLPPFTLESALEKVRLAEDGWNSRNPDKVALAYSADSKWRNRDTFIQGRAEIINFLTAKWHKEKEYKLVKELWAYTDNKIAVRYAYEWHDGSLNNDGQWYRSYGNENWEFDEQGLMINRYASINDVKIKKSERKFLWQGEQRPYDYPSLSELGL